MQHEASLTGIEDKEEFEWLRERIAKSYQRDRIPREGVSYYVGFHRYLFNTST